MKKRLVFISLALVMVMMMWVSSTALAGHDRSSRNNNFAFEKGDFSGSGLIYVTYMPDPVVKNQTWRYQDEIVEGFLDQCDWELLAGAVFWSEHDSTVRVDEQYNARGMMRGTFSLTRPDGSGSLTGTFMGRISGNLYTGDIVDQGSWQSTGGTGCFEGVRAWGKWSAELQFGDVGGQMTLVGPMSWSGNYMSKQDNNQDIREIPRKIKDRSRFTTESHVTDNIRDKVRDFCDNTR